jgi:hypothetical protein
MTFPEARDFLTGGPARPGKVLPGPGARPEPEPAPSAEPRRLSAADTQTVVDDAFERLWSAAGSKALANLTGPRRGLSPETIRRAQLGWIGPGTDGVPWRAPRVVIPWFDGGRLALVKLRVSDAWRARFPEGRRPPKYVEVFRDPELVALYPGPEAVRPGGALILTEGEFDTLVLGEALGGLAAVVTLGPASDEPTPAILGRFLSAARWFIATDRDEAGDRAAARWPDRARRVRPPGWSKDWSEAKAAGVDLARWWRDVLTGIERPPLFSWDELARWRWGGADDTPGIITPGRPLTGG